MHEEAGGFDIQLFADVFTDLDQILAALAAGARFRFMPMLDARQMLGQRLATRAFALGWLDGGVRLLHFDFQRAGVGIPAFLEQLALFRGELFALVGKANALVVSEFKGQRLDFKRVVFALVEQLAHPFRHGGIGVESGKFGG